jgi:hypothetical protein
MGAWLWVLVACKKDPEADTATVDWVLDDPRRACIACHPVHVSEWSQSMHAYAAVDPVLAAAARVAHDAGVDVAESCESCHAPLAAPFGEVLFDEAGNADPAALSPGIAQGVTCEACHMAVHEGTQNGNATRAFDGIMRAGVADAEPTDAHASTVSALVGSDGVCTDCHRQALGPLVVQDTPAESRASGSDSCASCHLEAYEGPAALGGPVRTIHRHNFPGVGVPLLDEAEFPGHVEIFDRAAYLLAGGLTLEATVDPVADLLTATITNLAGHDVPSGATTQRRLWVEVVLQNGARSVAFESGTLDELGNLRVDDPARTTRPGSDPHLVAWGHDWVDEAGVRVDWPWQATGHSGDVLAAGQVAVATWDLSALPTDHYYATVRLLFRAQPPWYLDSLVAEGGLDPAVPERNVLVVAATAELEVSLEGPRPEEPTVVCGDGNVPDCDGVCWPEFWIGDLVCDDGTDQPWGYPNFDCDAFAFDAGDCACGVDEIEDCSGSCFPGYWVGDGWCDDGTMEAWGDPDFDCDAFGMDGGDCTGTEPTGPCPPGEVEDCGLICRPDTWIGDGWCDDGQSYPWGDPDFACEVHAYDAGDCEAPTEPSECALAGWVPDCADACWPEVWVGDGFCDDGTSWPWGDPDFDCAAFADDAGDC